MGTLWHGGTIYTLKNEGDTVEAVFVEHGKIQAIGDYNDLIQKFKGEITEELNINGAVMYPGFVDSHLHMIGHGEKLLRLDLSEIKSSQKMIDELKQYTKNTSKTDWIIGEGWNENQLPDRKIFHKKELDEIAPDQPMMLTRVCRHAVIANTKALELAGVTNETVDPPGGVIVRDDEGKPTGYLLDQAQELVKSVIPKVSEEYIQKALSIAVNDLLSKGIVGGHSEDLNYYGGFKRTFDSFLNVINGKEVRFRANLLVHHEVVDDMHTFGYEFNSGSDYVQLGAMKIFADGALGGRTALLSQPYNDAPETSGVAIYEKDQLAALVRKAREYNMPVAIHTIGDLALEYALDAIEVYPPRRGQRDRLIHAQIVREDLLHRLKNCPVVLDIQPRFVASDFPWVIERLGEQRMDYSYAWKTLLGYGIPCAGGSDAPIEDVDPLLGIHAAVTRRHPEEKHEGYYQSEKLTVFEAVKLFTIGSAEAICAESNRGMIAEGFMADFTILDRDLFKIEPDEILNAKVVKTVVDNTVMYDKERE